MAGIVPRFPQPGGRDSRGFEGPIDGHNVPTDEKSGDYRSRFQRGGSSRVHIPEGSKDLALWLGREIQTIGPEFQMPIVGILRKIREVNPENMPDILERLSEFFTTLRDRLVGNKEDMKTVVDELVAELEGIARRNIQ